MAKTKQRLEGPVQGDRGVKDLSKRKLSQISKALKIAQVSFQLEIDKLADQARAEILPYFKKHNYDFVSGNGTWLISKPAADKAAYYRSEDHVKDNELPKNIRELLCLETERDQPLGFYIRDIKRGEW